MENEKKKIKYDPAYISYVSHGDSAAVLITRDIVKQIDTGGKWIDVLSVNGSQNYAARWDFKNFVVEIFPRITRPVYPVNASETDKKYVTWKTARTDIERQRNKGYVGPKYRIVPKLINRGTKKKPNWTYEILEVKRL